MSTHDDDTCPHLVRASLLEAENARLKAEVERLTAFTTRTIIPNEDLQAQVERLTKAGDAMAMTVYDMVSRKKPTYGSDLLDLAMQWKAAAKKGGRP